MGENRKGYRAVIYLRIEAELDEHTTEFVLSDRVVARIVDSVEFLSRGGTIQITQVTAKDSAVATATVYDKGVRTV